MRAANGADVRRPESSPSRHTARPAEPLRPGPATKVAIGHLALKARRSRYRLRPPAGR